LFGNFIAKWCQCWECAVCQFLSSWFFICVFLVAPRGYSLTTVCCTVIYWASLLISMFIWCVMSVHW